MRKIILAILIFWIKVKEKKKSKYTDKEHPGEILTYSVFKDRPFWIFLGATLITGILFFHLFLRLRCYLPKRLWCNF